VTATDLLKRRSSAPSARRITLSKVVRHIVLIAVGVLLIYPLLWMVTSSLKPEELIFRDPSLLPETIDFSNYTDGWNALSSPFGLYLLNSGAIVLGSLLGNLITCSMAAYAFAKLEFRGKKIFFALMLMTLMLPIHVLIVPQYVLFSNLGWVNTFLPLIVPKFLATDAFFIFLMVQFFRGLPKELDEAARIDGAGYWRTYFQVLLPLSVPALATTAIFTFIWTWNDFFGQLIYLTDSSVFTVPIALNALVDSESNQGTGTLMAMSVLSLIPLLLFFAFAQKHLIRGIATTGLK